MEKKATLNNEDQKLLKRFAERDNITLQAALQYALGLLRTEMGEA